MKYLIAVALTLTLCSRFAECYCDSFDNENGYEKRIERRIYHFEYMVESIKSSYGVEEIQYGSSHPMETYHYARGQLEAYITCLDLLNESKQQHTP